MTITFIGIIQAVIGLILLVRGSLAAMLGFMILAGAFGGSAAIVLGSGSSIPPAQFALAFIWLRMIIPGSRFLPSIGPAIRDNLWLVVYTIYGLAIAYVGPRIFAGDINITPLRFSGAGGGLYDTVPLEVTSQNTTASIYLIGLLLTGIAAYVACLYRGGANALVRAMVITGWLHIITGVAAAVGRGTVIDTFIASLRNATYTQHEQAYEGIARINGLFPEPSSWASFGFSLFVFTAECWYRSIEPKSTGRCAMVLALVLFASTSSTAYVGLFGYVAFFVLRMAIFPNLASHSRLKEAAAVVLAGVVITALMLLFIPAFTSAVGEMLNTMLFAKAESDSGRQRLFWALQGVDSFLISWGLGIGPGSFRSSSIATAILGSCGVIGVVSFVAYLIHVVEPRRGSSWGVSGTVAQRLGGAAASTVLLSMLPLMVAAPSPIPGGEFAIMAGAALALRRLKQDAAVPGDATYPDNEPDDLPQPRGWRTRNERA